MTGGSFTLEPPKPKPTHTNPERAASFNADGEGDQDGDGERAKMERQRARGEREARERLSAERRERERLARERADREGAEQAEHERLARLAKEKAVQEQRERERRERKARKRQEREREEREREEQKQEEGFRLRGTPSPIVSRPDSMPPPPPPPPPSLSPQASPAQALQASLPAPPPAPAILSSTPEDRIDEHGEEEAGEEEEEGEGQREKACGVKEHAVLADGWVVERTWKTGDSGPDPERHLTLHKTKQDGTCVLDDGWVVERSLKQDQPRPDPERHHKRNVVKQDGTCVLMDGWVVERSLKQDQPRPDPERHRKRRQAIEEGQCVLDDGWVVERTVKQDQPRPDPQRHRNRNRIKQDGTCVLMDGWVVERSLKQDKPRPDPERHRKRQLAMEEGLCSVGSPFPDLLGPSDALKPEDEAARESFEDAEFDPLLFVLDFPVTSFSPLGELRLFFSALRFEFRTTNVGFASLGGSLNWVETFSAKSNRVFRSYGAFVLARLLLLGVCSFFVLSSLTSFSRTASLAYWAIYLTNWTLSVEWLYFLFAFVTAFCSVRWEASDAVDPLPWYVRAMWFTQAIALPGTLLVTLMYWAIVNDRPMAEVQFTQVSSHGLGFVLMLLDSLMFAQPYLLLHGIYLCLFGAAYMLFNMGYQMLGFHNEHGEPSIYPPIDWNEPASTAKLSFALLMVGVPMVNVLVWWTFFLRGNFQLRMHATSALSRAQSPKFQLHALSQATMSEELARLAQARSSKRASSEGEL